MMKYKRLLLLLPLVLAISAVTARADTYTLTVDHCSGGCGSSPFGTITTSNIAGGVNVVISLTDANKFVLTGPSGGGSTVAFNLAGNPTISLTGATLTGWSLDSTTAGSISFDGFGTFEYSLNCCNNTNGGGAAQTGPISFNILGTGVTTASFNELSVGGSPSVFFAVDILSGTTQNTGPVGTGTPTVPEPTSLVTLGIALVALAGARRLRS